MDFWTDPDGWSYGISCTICGGSLTPHRFFHIYETRHLDADLSVHVDEGEAVGELCSSDCTSKLEKLVTDSLEPTALYPPLAKIVACAECGRDVNRLEPHLVLVHMECQTVENGYASSDDEREIAVFCQSCRQPSAHEQISDDLEDEVCTTSSATFMAKI